MTYASEIQPVLHSVFHSWHWNKENYIAAASSVLSFSALVFSIRSSKRAIMFAQTTQLLSLSEKFLAKIPVRLNRDDRDNTGSLRKPWVRPYVEAFYSVFVTFIQTVESYNLDNKSKELILESLWLQCAPYVWEEIAKGTAATYICSDNVGTETLSSHRETVCKAFSKVIKKHKDNSLPINVRPPVKKEDV